MNNDNPKFFKHHEFYSPFVADLRRARALVIIQSPYLTIRRIEVFAEEIQACNRRGVRICVVAQEPKYWDQRADIPKLKPVEGAIQLLQNMDVHVTLSPRVHEKLAIIDEEILWDGSMNILSYFDTKERMARWISRDMVRQVIVQHNLDLCTACSARLPLPLLPVNDDLFEVESRQLIGKFIARRRYELRMSQEELGLTSAMPQAMVSQIELGTRNVKYDTLYRIAKVLEIRLLPISWHFTRKLAELMDYSFSHEPVGEASSKSKVVTATQAPCVQARDDTLFESMLLIGQFITRRRCELGMSQEELGLATGTPQTVVSQIEQGKRNVHCDRLYRIATVLGFRLLPVTWRLTGKMAVMMDYNFPAEPIDKGVAVGVAMPAQPVIGLPSPFVRAIT
jgi:transcriptional regulator with XRE-family HTH domain